MAELLRHDLSLAETSALALDEAATALDRADSTDTFLLALERNRKVWEAVADVAAHHKWRVPSRRVSDYALSTSRANGRLPDEHVHNLIDLNRQISRQLAGDDIERIRERAHGIWENRGRPEGEELDHWLLAEMEIHFGPDRP